MNQTPTLLDQALAHHQAGDLQAAEPLYRRVLDADPEQWDALYLLGTALLQAGRFDECVPMLGRVTAARPDIPDAHNNLGVAHKALGHWEEAAKAFQAALRANPEYAQALFNLGSLMQERGLSADAEKCFRHALQLGPDDEQVKTALAGVLKTQHKWPEAETCYRELLQAGSDDSDLKVNLGFILARQEKLDEAADIYRQILAARPDYHQIHNSLSYVHERQGRLEEALAAAERALKINPDYAEGYNNLGTALKSLHRFDQACLAFQKAIERTADFPLAEFNLGTTRLLLGDFEAGWTGYDRRIDTVETDRRTFSKPLWNGDSLSGSTLLVHSDQGFGDAIQFIRFLPQVKARSEARLILECEPELLPLFAGLPDVDEFIAEGSPLPEYHAHVPLAGLPSLFRVDLDTIPAEIPYLSAPESLRDEFRALLDEVGDSRRKVGFAWQGNPQQARDAIRSLPPARFQPLFELEEIAPFSLQTGLAPGKLNSLDPDHRPVDLGTQLQNFAETASVIDRLDLVITVDTAVAHLAGALGKPVWTLLCHTPDWRWLLERTDSPWYPTMRLFRQPAWGDWDAVIKEVHAALTAEL